jgi:hypothetical protein
MREELICKGKGRNDTNKVINSSWRSKGTKNDGSWSEGIRERK